MKSGMTFLTAAVFVTGLTVPVFAQIGAGVAGNATIGNPPTANAPAHAGANADVANSDAERAEPTSPSDQVPTSARLRALHSEGSTNATDASGDRSVGAGDASPNVSSTSPRIDRHINGGIDNSPTGGY